MRTKTPAIALISSPQSAYARVVPAALLYLSSWLMQQGIESEIIDVKRNTYQIRSEPQIDSVIRQIILRLKITKPPFVGLSCMTIDYRSVMKLARAIKEMYAPVVIVGGIHATVSPQDFLYPGSPVDIAVAGEGEETLTEILSSSASPQELSRIKGIAFRRDQEVVVNPARPFLQLNRLSLPAYDKIDMHAYTRPQRGLVRFLLLSGAHIFTSRGCPYACTFCASSSQEVRNRPVSGVVEELAFLKDNYGIDGFYIYDDTFCLDKRRVVELLAGLKGRNLRFVWGVQTRVNLLDDDLIGQLKEGGCIQVDLGVESGSDKVLERMKKGIAVSEILKAFTLLRKHRMRTYANILFNTPGETKGDVRRTIEVMRKIRSTIYGIALTVPFVGTPIYQDFVHPRLTADEYAFYEKDIYHSVVDPRFRLAQHNLDLNKLYLNNFIRFGAWRHFIDVTANTAYWRTVLKSTRKVEYLWEFFRGLFKLLDPLVRHVLYFVRS